VLSRAVRGEDRSPVLVLAAAGAKASLATEAQMEHAYGLRYQLQRDWAAEPLELCHLGDRLALVSRDPGGQLLVSAIGKPWELTPFLRIAIGLAGALDGLHRRGLVHKNLKPANILVDVQSGEVWLTGFGLTSLLPRERRAPEPPEVIAGTLPYMAPEQTGRVNRSIDSRSDLYSCGVTLYAMLTGALPFTASDPMEWIHSHIARLPVPAAERTGGMIPGPLSEIVSKLLAKNAEDRYQTAGGLEADLKRCLSEWESHGRIDPFVKGTQDVPDRLVIPERLYGREEQIQVLVAAFERVVATGTPELVLVSGYSGIGKSSVVHELEKSLVPPRALFASGKFDQYKRDVPYATLAAAFRSLILPILGQSDPVIESWRDALRLALGANAQLIVNLIPELEFIVGKQPPVSALPPQDEQRRFQTVFRRFIGVFARPEHPLVLFLDDLQWLDPATLDLVQHLTAEPEVRCLLLIGAYRDNEVNSSHPLFIRLQAMRDTGAKITDLRLAPLRLADVTQFLAEALRCSTESAHPLAELVQEKTGGNPFFTIQFVSALAEEGLLSLDRSVGQWTWDISSIQKKEFTDNVVDLMIAKLNRLPQRTQATMQVFACLGDSAPTSALSMVEGRTEEETHAALWEAVNGGLIFRTPASYVFLHDRIQEAAYALIPNTDRAALHLRIGRVLKEATLAAAQSDTIFELANQFNRAVDLIALREEREEVATLNLAAGKRAKASTAHASALAYFEAGLALLPDDIWKAPYDLVFPLLFHRAECELLTGALEPADEHLSMLARHAASLVDKGAVACMRILLYLSMGRSGRAIGVGMEYLQESGVDWPLQPTDEDVNHEYHRIRQQLGTTPIGALLNSPLMPDANRRATMDVLTEMLAPAIPRDMNLRDLILLRMASFSIEHGNCDASCQAYGMLNMVIGYRFGDYAAGDQFGQLSLDLVEHRGLNRFKARAYCCLHAWLRPGLDPCAPLGHTSCGPSTPRLSQETSVTLSTRV
jgi:predicted ATPase